jgi:predicted MFS family arabinose efflux permease
MHQEKAVPLRELLPLLMAIFVDLLGFGLVYPVLAAMIMSSSSILPANTSADMRSLILSLGYFLHPICMLFGASLLGDLSDYLGRKKVLVLCMFLLTTSFFLMALGAYLKTITLFLIGRAVSGLMAGSQPIAQATVADFSQGAVKARNMAILAFTNSISLMLGPLVGGVLSDSTVVSFFSFWTPFLFATVLALIAVLWIYFGFYECHSSHSRKKIKLSESIAVFKQAFKHPSIKTLALILILMQVAVSIYLQYMIIYLGKTYHYTSYQMGIFNAYIGALFAIGLLIFVPILAKRFVFEKIACVNLVISTVAMLGMAIYPKELVIWILSIPLSVALNIAFSMLMTTFSNQEGKEKQGWVMGIFGASIAVSFTLGGLLANLLPYLQARGLIFLGGGCFFLSALLMYSFNKKHTLYGPRGPVIKKF